MMKDIGKMYSANRGTSVRRFLFSLLLGVSSTMVWAQGNVSGKVVDATGEPVIGASVMVKGTSIGAVTDLDGNFTISVPSNAVLVFSFVGLDTQEVPVAGKKFIEVTLSGNEELEEVIVVGYGTQKKSDITGSVASVDKARLRNFLSPTCCRLFRAQLLV